MILGFLATILIVVVGVHLYLWHRLVGGTTRPGPVRRVLTWVTVGLGLLVLVTVAASRQEVGHWVAWPGWLWVAIMFYLVVFLVVLEIPRFIANRLAGRGDPVSSAVSPGADPSITRRLLIGRTVALAAGAGALGTVGYGVRTAFGAPTIEPVKVRLPKLDPRLSGLRFAVVSDIHLGPLTGLGHTERIVRMINELEADVVTIVGDLVDGTVAELGSLARPLGRLESRYGAYFVTGNHEYYAANGPQEWIEELDSLGVRALRNSRVEIRHGGAVLDLAGVNDVNGAAYDDGPDFAAALGGRVPGRSTVLLAHQPVQVRQAAPYGVDLQLSGHTHGGQLVPFNLAVAMQQPVVSGLARVDGVQIYVTRGAGFWGPPARVGAPPEITMVEIGAEG